MNKERDRQYRRRNKNERNLPACTSRLVLTGAVVAGAALVDALTGSTATSILSLLLSEEEEELIVDVDDDVLKPETC